MDSIISTFHIDWKIIVAQAINFGVVFAALYVFALKPLSKLMGERSDKINRGIDDAKINAEMLQNTRAEYDRILREAKREASTIFQQGKKEAEAKKTAMIEEAEREVAGLVHNGKKMLDGEKTKMVDDAKKEIVSLAMAALSKLISEENPDGLSKNSIKELNNL